MEEEKVVTKTEQTKKHKKLKIFSIVIAVIIVMIIIALLIYYFYNKKQNEMEANEIRELEQILKNSEMQIEYGSEIRYQELKNENIDMEKMNDKISYQIFINDEPKLDEENIKFMKIGEVKIKTELKSTDESKKRLKINCDKSNFMNFIKNFKITYDSKEYLVEKNNTYTVKDTKKPEIEGVSDKEIFKGQDIDLKEGIKATDVVDGELDVTVEGQVNKDEVGEYPIKVIAKDKNGNETVQEFKVIVKEEEKIQSNQNKKTSTSSSSKSNNSSSGKSNTSSTNNGTSNNNNQSRRYSAYIIKKYYKNCTDDQIDEAEKIAKNIASKAKASSSEPITQVSNAAKSVSEYYYKYCNYDSTYSNPYYRSPYGVFCAGIATCSGTTRAMGRVLDYMGYSWTHVNENQYTHQWNEFYINGQKCWADGMMGFAGIGDYPY